MAPKSESPTQPEPTQTRPRHCHTRPSGPVPCGGVLCSRWAGVLPRRRLLPSHALAHPFLLFVVLFLQWQNPVKPRAAPLLPPFGLEPRPSDSDSDLVEAIFCPRGSTAHLSPAPAPLPAERGRIGKSSLGHTQPQGVLC